MGSTRSNIKRKIIIISIAIGIICMFLAQPATAIVFKIATLSPEGSFWMKKMRAGAEEVTRKTDRRVRFKFYPGGVMGDERAVMRKIRVGQLHGGAITSGGLSKFFSDNQIYNLPIKFNSFDEVDYVRSRMDDIIVNGHRKGGFVTFGIAEGGFAYLMSKTPITTVEDLRRHKVWIPKEDTLSLETARAFGITPIPLSVSEVRTALQTGLIDTVASSPIGAIALQWHTQINYLTDTPLIYLYAVLAIDRKAFDKISPQDQQIVNDVMRRVWKEIDRQNRQDNISALQALRNQEIQFVRPADPEQEVWKNTAAVVPRRMVESGKLSRDIVIKLEKYLQDYRMKESASNEQS